MAANKDTKEQVETSATTPVHEEESYVTRGLVGEPEVRKREVGEEV